jgi:metal-responsive CopG/Arc/MetJ family transcriptional regulator
MKVAVSVPDPVFDAADRLAKERGIARSQLFAEALEEYLARHGSEAITATLNEIYGARDSSVEPALAKAQNASLDHEAW